MPKYTEIKSNPKNDHEWMLQNIANELAEANRLKRWEIKLSHKEIKDTTIEKELKDQI